MGVGPVGLEWGCCNNLASELWWMIIRVVHCHRMTISLHQRVCMREDARDQGIQQTHKLGSKRIVKSTLRWQHAVIHGCHAQSSTDVYLIVKKGEAQVTQLYWRFRCTSAATASLI